MLFSGEQSGDRSAVAKVTNNQDPERRGRIKVTCPALLGDESSELPGWIETALPWGWFAIPDVGQQVTVYYTSETSADTFAGQSSISNANVRWYGSTHFTGPQAIEDRNPIGTEFTLRNYGKRRGFKTPAGHVMMFDDTLGDSQIQMSWAGGTPVKPKNAYWSIDRTGSFIIQDAGGALFYMNSAKVADGKPECSIVHPSGNRIVINEDGISMVDKHGNAIIMNSDGISFLSQKPVTIMGSDTIIRNGMHFVDSLGANTNVGAVVSLMNPTNPENAALVSAVGGAVPADGVALLQGLSTVTIT